MKPGPPQTWRGAMAGPRGASGCGSAFPLDIGKPRPSSAALTLRGFIAPFVIDGPIDRLAFEAYVEKVLLPELRKGDVVIMDNLPGHKGPRVREMIEAAGARLLYLPPYSPTSIPSRTLSPSSRRCCERPPSEPSKASGRPSANSSISSRLTKSKTCSPPLATMHDDRLSL